MISLSEVPRETPFDSVRFGLVQADFVWFQLVPVGVGWPRLVPLGFGRFRLAPIGFDRLWLVPTCCGWTTYGTQIARTIKHSESPNRKRVVYCPGGSVQRNADPGVFLQISTLQKPFLQITTV